MLTFREFSKKIDEDPALAESYVRYWHTKQITSHIKANFSKKGLSGVAIGKKGHKPILTIGKKGIRHSFSSKKFPGFSYVVKTQPLGSVQKPVKQKRLPKKLKVKKTHIKGTKGVG